MINYIIIEDEVKYCKTYENIIKEIMVKTDLDYDIKSFSSYNNKLNQIINDNTIYKIYLIDIGLNGNKTGIDIAKEIRLIDLTSEIIFITSEDLLFENVFKNVHKVYAFISKNYKTEIILNYVLNEIVSIYIKNTRFFLLDKKGDSKVAINDILYIYRETSERKVYVVTKHNKYPTYLNLKDILDKYKHCFIQIHRACLINPCNIGMYNWTESYFVLKNGEQVFMCSKKYKNNTV